MMIESRVRNCTTQTREDPRESEIRILHIFKPGKQDAQKGINNSILILSQWMTWAVEEEGWLTIKIMIIWILYQEGRKWETRPLSREIW